MGRACSFGAPAAGGPELSRTGVSGSGMQFVRWTLAAPPAGGHRDGIPKPGRNIADARMLVALICRRPAHTGSARMLTVRGY
ncbi:hypothetical protein FAIPA1_70216 [Frankia sp. AiPs1]